LQEALTGGFSLCYYTEFFTDQPPLSTLSGGCFHKEDFCILKSIDTEPYTKKRNMKNPESLIPDLKELGLLMLGFLPWMLFLFFSGHTLLSLKIAIVISLVASVTLGFGDLKRGFILQWGTCIFFIICLIMVNFLNNVWIAMEMDLISN